MTQLQLGEVDLALLSLVGKDPLRANRTIASMLGISRETVARHLKFLQESGHLLGVSSQIRYSRVGLQTLLVLMHCNPEDWPVLEKVCQLHPYTRYRIRFVGTNNGLLALFAVPQGNTGMVVELLEALVEQKQIKGYEVHIPSANTVSSEMDFQKYSLGKGWRFDWLKWERGLDNDPQPLSPLSESLQHMLGAGDMRILKQISMDVLRPQGEIARAARVSDSHLSRRLDLYSSTEIIEGYRVLSGEFLTGMVNVVIFKGNADFSVVKRIAAGVPKLPFQCTFLPDGNRFFFYMSIPPTDVPTVSKILSRNTNQVEMLWGDYLSSYRWSFYPDPFVNGRWRADHDFMVKEIMEGLKPSAT